MCDLVVRKSPLLQYLASTRVTKYYTGKTNVFLPTTKTALHSPQRVRKMSPPNKFLGAACHAPFASAYRVEAAKRNADQEDKTVTSLVGDALTSTNPSRESLRGVLA
jgi:hypothetical protein